MMQGKVSDSEFTRQLRRALYRLYDPVVLSQSPLMDLFGLDRTRPSTLQRVLCDAIEALRPEPAASPQSDAWRTYRTLTHRFVDQFSQSEVARVLGLSTRQMRRKESAALRALADYLETHYHLDVGEPASTSGHLHRTKAFSARSTEQHAPQHRRASPREAALAPLEADHLLETPDAASSPEQELQWLEQSLPSEAVAAEEVILPPLRVAAPLAAALGVYLKSSIPDHLPHLMVQLASIRQVLVNVLTAGIHAVPGGRVDLRVTARQQEVCIHIEPVLLQEAARAAARLVFPPGGCLGREREKLAPRTRIERATCPLGGGCSIH